MALIKRGSAGSDVGSAIALDLGDIAREAAKLKEAARAEADRIVADARAERERLIADAAAEGERQGYERGYAAGEAEGRDAGERAAKEEAAARLEGVAAGWDAALRAFEGQRDALMHAASEDLIVLAALVAEHVAGRVVEIDRGVASRAAASILETVADATSAVVRVHPEDEDSARDAIERVFETIGASGHASIEADASLSPGSCVVTTRDGGVFDATVETRVARLVREILGDRERGAESSPAPSIQSGLDGVEDLAA